MTVLVGIVHNERVWLGADSAATIGYQQFSYPHKLWRQGELLLGVTGDAREGQIVEHCTTLPELPEDADVYHWLVTDFIGAVRKARTDHGYDEKRVSGSGVSVGPALLIGVRGRLFMLDSAYAILEHVECAYGSGSAVALGSLHTSGEVWRSPKRRIEGALTAACEHDIYCAEPLQIIHT